MLEKIKSLNKKEWFNPCMVNVVLKLFGKKASVKLIEFEKSRDKSYKGPCMKKRTNVVGLSLIVTAVIFLTAGINLVIDKYVEDKSVVKPIVVIGIDETDLLVVDNTITDVKTEEVSTESNKTELNELDALAVMVEAELDKGNVVTMTSTSDNEFSGKPTKTTYKIKRKNTIDILNESTNSRPTDRNSKEILNRIKNLYEG